jgi:tryptophan-rich sensory protein
MSPLQILPEKIMAGKKIIYLVLAVGICLLAGYIGSYYTTPEIPTWYASLQKPDITPPSWVFAPVWTVLYILMGLSLYLIIQSGLKNPEVKVGLILFIFQLVLNVGWSFFFFGRHSTFYGFLAIVLLWAILLCTIIQMFRISFGAALLLVPYLVWITFAAYLTYAIMMLNPASFGITF